jgi:hypothetical protein
MIVASTLNRIDANRNSSGGARCRDDDASVRLDAGLDQTAASA